MAQSLINLNITIIYELINYYLLVRVMLEAILVYITIIVRLRLMYIVCAWKF